MGATGRWPAPLAEAVRYYRETAHPWELQALIRARSSAGAATIYSRFAEAVRDRVYRSDETVARALAHVRLAKRKIDRHHAKAHGFNVKLGRGGIREIEFIAQALQLAYGGRDVWLQAPHTLISLGRLADRAIITDREYTNLSDAYTFLRKLEHRLQMEEGLQTHALPEDPQRRALVARRMHFSGFENHRAAFDLALATHTENVHAVFKRVFGEAGEIINTSSIVSTESPQPIDENSLPLDFTVAAREDTAAAQLKNIAAIFSAHLNVGKSGLIEQLDAAMQRSSDPKRALASVERIAYSLAKLSVRPPLNCEQLVALIELCGSSEYFTEMISEQSISD
ncbi:MAG: hypothetical protein WKF84_00150 [Pyrinomonadaceae bacterium]